MGLRRNIYFKRIIVLIFIVFSIFFSASVFYVFKSGKKTDLQHIKVISLSAEVDNRILETRISIDIYLKNYDAEIIAKARNDIDTIHTKLEKLNFIFTEEFKRIKNNDLSDFTNEYRIISTKLHLFRDYINKEQIEGTKLLVLYTGFSTSYRRFGQYVHRYLFDNTMLYEKEIWSLIFILLFLVILAGYLIFYLINRLIITDRNLIRDTIEIESRERQRIAADLHDELGAYLSGLIMYIEVLEQESENNPALESKIAQAGKLSRQAIQSVEVIVNNLNPSYLSRLGLTKTLAKTIGKINALNKTKFQFDSSDFKLNLPSGVEITLYRICTELINNALKHSSAKNALLSLSNYGKKVNLKYEDDGVGFKHEVSEFENTKSGLYNLTMRVDSLGGSITVDSEPGKGVKISISLIVN